jgi:hypothetical protein
MPRNRESSANAYTPLEEILRDKERESRIGSSANEHTPLHEILSDAPARRSRTTPLSPPDPRDSDPLHAPLIVAPRYHWSDNVRSQYTDQLNKLYDAHPHDGGPTAAQIEAVRDWGSDLADREATEARFLAHGWSPAPWRDYSIHNYSDGKQNFTHPVGPQLVSGRGDFMSPLDQFNAIMAPRTGGPFTAMAAALNPHGDFTSTRQADDLFLALGGVTAARAGQSSSFLGTQGKAWDAGPGSSAATWRWTTPGEAFYHYGRMELAPSFSGGLRRNSFATGTGLLTGPEAQTYLALRERPDAVYTISPNAGTLIGVNPVVERKYKQPGEGHEYLFPTGTDPGTVSWPRSIP